MYYMLCLITLDQVMMNAVKTLQLKQKQMFMVQYIIATANETFCGCAEVFVYDHVTIGRL